MTRRLATLKFGLYIKGTAAVNFSVHGIEERRCYGAEHHCLCLAMQPNDQHKLYNFSNLWQDELVGE
ncbi:hypothetical protein Avbf_08544 [Armadillidium vulgare]|nr:hypothetical protein Avbf_08544 [Armadillidium vulgare]